MPTTWYRVASTDSSFVSGGFMGRLYTERSKSFQKSRVRWVTRIPVKKTLRETGRASERCYSSIECRVWFPPPRLIHVSSELWCVNLFRNENLNHLREVRAAFLRSPLYWPDASSDYPSILAFSCVAFRRKPLRERQQRVLCAPFARLIVSRCGGRRAQCFSLR